MKRGWCWGEGGGLAASMPRAVHPAVPHPPDGSPQGARAGPQQGTWGANAESVRTAQVPCEGEHLAKGEKENPRNSSVKTQLFQSFVFLFTQVPSV